MIYIKKWLPQPGGAYTGLWRSMNSAPERSNSLILGDSQGVRYALQGR